jgi:tetratricopeptide (TPR) repeat protein
VRRLLTACTVAIVLIVATLGAQGSTGGLGRISFPTSGPPAAQPAFVRGVALLHNFEYDEAIAAFREAQRLAPRFAMAYWGEALCYSQPLWYNENVAKAREALARLAPARPARAATAPTAREKGYLDAVERLFGEGDRAGRQRAYADRMAILHGEHPEDDEAALFYALALLATIPEGARRPAISMQAGALALAVLKRNPAHPGAAHYALHAYDDGEHNRLGLEAARIYAKMAPASSHALHMPSHIFLPLGLWDEAAAADEASWAASVAWVKETGRTLAQQDFHSLSWLHYEYLQQGRFAQAHALIEPVQRALQETQGAAPGASTQHEHVESEIGRGYGPMSLKNELASMRAREVIDSGDWTRMQGQGTFDNVDELFALGMSSVKLGDLARADAVVEHLQEASRTLPDRDLRDVVAIMASQVTGLLQIARGEQAAGLATLAHTADQEALRPKPIARPYPVKPAAELYAEALLAAGQSKAAAAAAVAQFQRALARTPRRAPALLGLAKAARTVGMTSISARAARDFLDTWHHADANRPELAEARSFLASTSAKPRREP